MDECQPLDGGGGGSLRPPPSCPLLIIRRARGAAPLRRGGAGFTLVAPAGWALPLWLSLVHLGARTAGLREWWGLADSA